MSTRAWFGLLIGFLAVALFGSAFLYKKSLSADMAGNAAVVSTVGHLRQQKEHFAQLVLSARFGLLNQYDSLTKTSLELDANVGALRGQVARVVGTDGEIGTHLDELAHAVSEMREGVERFKADNAILKNSIYYLPTAAGQLSNAQDDPKSSELLAAVRQQVEAALTYNLIGDASSGTEMTRAVASLERQVGKQATPSEALSLLAQHARLILEKQPSVDRHTRAAVNNGVGRALDGLAGAYAARFNAQVAASDTYRKILYGWSIALLLGLTLIGWQLRRLYKTLEQRVTERTAELKEAMSQLWGEMKLARKIQESLVPKQPELARSDVAVEMRAAAEVGGDYYDVVHTKGNEWILIGDVSGHGVPAGLIMMMCQTAVRTALAQNPNLLPSELLECVNRVLTDNIRQLGENKYMTISALRRDPNGVIHVAGAHQDIYIYRASDDRVETITTQGVWLGLKSNIKNLLKTQTFRLHESDVLVLYTDGITEATKQDRLFDTSGLKAVISEARGKSADELLRAVFEAIADHEVADDATALIIRQLPASESSAVA